MQDTTLVRLKLEVREKSIQAYIENTERDS